MAPKPPSVTYQLELDDCPSWLSHLEVSREGNVIHFQIVKSSGVVYLEARVSDLDFNDMADHLLTRKG